MNACNVSLISRLRRFNVFAPFFVIPEVDSPNLRKRIERDEKLFIFAH